MESVILGITMGVVFGLFGFVNSWWIFKRRQTKLEEKLEDLKSEYENRYREREKEIISNVSTAYKEQVAQLVKKINSINSKIADRIKGLYARIENLEKENKMIKRELLLTVEEKESIEKQLLEIKRAYQDLKGKSLEEIENLRKERNSLLGENKELKNQIKDLENTIKEKDEVIAKLGKEIEQEKKQKEEEIKRKEREIQLKSEELKQKVREIDQKVKEIQLKDEKIKTLEEEVKKERERVREVEKELYRIRDNTFKLEKQLSEKDREIEKREKKIEDMEKRISVLKKEISTKEELINSLRLEIKALERKVKSVVSNKLMEIPKEVISAVIETNLNSKKVVDYFTKGVEVRNYKILINEEHDTAFNLIFASEQEVFLTAPFLSERALEKKLPIIEKFLKDGGKLTLIINKLWGINNAKTGETDLFLLFDVLEKYKNQVSVYAGDIHQKVLIGKGKAVISSYNFLSKDNKRKETGILIEDSSFAQEFFQNELENFKDYEKVSFIRFVPDKFNSSLSEKSLKIISQEKETLYYPITSASKILLKKGEVYEAIVKNNPNYGKYILAIRKNNKKAQENQQGQIVKEQTIKVEKVDDLEMSLDL